MSVVLDVYVDCLGQEIEEGKCCVFKKGNSSQRFGVVVESRKLIKVAFCSQRYLGWDAKRGKNIYEDVLTVVEDWVSREDIVIVEEEWLFSKLDGMTLMKMATIKAEVRDKVAWVMAAKERKRAREEAKEIGKK